MDENNILKTILPILKQKDDIVVGPGDDCAAIDFGDPDRLMLQAVDQLISDVHYDSKKTTPERAGAKLLKRNISDIAAMGGKPAYALVTLATDNSDIKWMEKFYNGLSEEADKWGLSICGGDLALLKHDQLLVSTLSITGFVDKNKICLRKNAKPGDLLFATGRFGDSFHSEHHLDFIPRVREAEFIAGTYTCAMMDISDGLLIDLERFATASDVCVNLDLKAIPSRKKNLDISNILSDGEDYELIFTVKPEAEKELLEKWPFNYVKLSKIGNIGLHDGVFVKDLDGNNLIKKHKKGWDHFNFD